MKRLATLDFEPTQVHIVLKLYTKNLQTVIVIIKDKST